MISAYPFLRRAASLCVLLALAACGRGGSVDALLAEARQARDKGDNKTAVIHLKNALQEQEGNGEARLLLGQIYLDLGDFRSAEKELRRATEISGDKSRTLAPLVRALLGEGEFRKALEETESQSGAGEAEILSLRGLAQLGLNDAAEATRCFDKALSASPDFPDALVGKARLAAMNRDFPGALALADRALGKSDRHRDALLLRGDLLRATGQVGKAEDAYRKVLEVHPENVAARFNLASLAIAAGDFDGAAEQAADIKRVAPNNPISNYVLGLIEFRKQNYAEARDLVLQVLKVAPGHQPSLLLAGATEFALGSYAQSGQYLRAALEKTPGNLYARKLQVGALLRSRQVARALEALQPALRQAPDDPSVLALAGEVYMQNSEYAKAAHYFERAAKADPKSAQAKTGLGLSRLATGDVERAFVELEGASAADSSKYQADVVLVMSSLAKGDFARAEKAVAALAKKQPGNPLTWNLQAAVLLGRKKNAEARASYEKALSLAPDYFPAILNLAQLDLQEKKPEAARARLDALTSKDPNHLQALLALASLAPRLGANEADALAWLEKARKGNPTAAQPRIVLSRYYLQKGNAKKALEYAVEASAVAPESADTLDTLGLTQMAAGEKNAATTTYTKLVALQPNSAGALVRLANAQFVTENLSAASAALRKALELSPGLTEAQTALAVIELRMGHPAGALKLAEQLQQANPKASAGFVLAGDVNMAQKKYPAAAAAYEKALALASAGPLLIKLHAARAAAGKPEEGDARLQAWLRQHPEDAAVRLYLADSALKAAKPKVAIEQYEWLLKTQPQNVLVLNNLAWAYHQVNDPRGIELAAQALKNKPDSAAVMDTYGWMLATMGKLEEGLNLLEKAVSSAPDQQEIRYHYAAALAKSGKKEQARIELERLVASGVRFPQETEASALLAELKK